MKSLKTIISLLVAFCIIATMSVVAFAEDSSMEDTSSIEVVETTQEKLDANKIIKFDKFDGENFDGDTDKIGTNGLLYANGKEVNGLTYFESLDLGKTWQASVTFNRENNDTSATKNCFGEKYIFRDSHLSRTCSFLIDFHNTIADNIDDYKVKNVYKKCLGRTNMRKFHKIAYFRPHLF